MRILFLAVGGANLTVGVSDALTGHWFLGTLVSLIGVALLGTGALAEFARRHASEPIRIRASRRLGDLRR